MTRWNKNGKSKQHPLSRKECPGAGDGPSPKSLLSNKEEYRKYLRSSEWSAVREVVLVRAEHRCEECGRDGGGLQVHHKTYVRFGRELPEDLEALCRECHRRRHGEKRTRSKNGKRRHPLSRDERLTEAGFVSRENLPCPDCRDNDLARSHLGPDQSRLTRLEGNYRTRIYYTCETCGGTGVVSPATKKEALDPYMTNRAIFT